ncbi:MAG: histidine phosphatase family protein [Nanoarchaeota archaeon]|nr:histidine phosphatase family protein [Nanoarchaeota archaeon]
MAYADGEYPLEIVYNEHSEGHFEPRERKIVNERKDLMPQIASIYLIRHAHALQQTMTEYFWGRSYEMPLTPKGKEQACRLKDRLMREELSFDKILCSPAVRTIETLEISLPEYSLEDVIFEDNLAEQGRGIWAGRKRVDVLNPDIERRIQTDMWNFKIAGMESAYDVARRMEKTLKGHAERFEGNIAVFTHSGAIRNLLTHILGFDKKDFGEIPIENTSITCLSYNKGIWTLEKLNDYSHLQETA